MKLGSEHLDEYEFYLPREGIPLGWEIVSLNDVSFVVTDGTHKTPKYISQGVRFISIKNIRPYRPIDWNVYEKYISRQEHEALIERCHPEYDDVLFPRIGTLGFAKRIDFNEEVSIFVGLGLIKPIKAYIFPKYLEYYMNTPYIDRLSFKRAKGTGRKTLPLEESRRFPFPVAPLSEQHRIVAKIEELFSELDKGVESLKTAQAQLKVYRQAVLKHAFEGKLTAQWREENKDKLEKPERLIERISTPVQPRGGRAASVGVIEGIAAMAVNIPLKAPPPGWSWVPLLRIARQETGHTPSRAHPEYWDGDQDWIGIADARLHHGKEIQDTIQKVTRKGLENSSARTLPARTVCLSRTASVGYVCIMAKPMATSQDFATWTCTEALEPKFLMYALMAEGDEIRRFGKGTTHTTIYFPEIRAMTICLPPLEEQNVIIDAVEAKLQQLDALAAEIDSSLARGDALRQSILKRAFSGQLVPQEPDDEPASVLLDRIRAEREKALKNNHSKKTKKRKTTA